MITVAFRLDDPSPLSDHALEARLFELFAHHGIPLTVAVVPFALSPHGSCIAASVENCPHVVEAHRAGIVEIALHGHSHINRSPPQSPSSEFSGVPLAVQDELIREGKIHLERLFRCDIDGFVPPWNSFDVNTAKVAQRCGLKYISAGWDRPPLDRFELSIIPRTCTLRSVDRTLSDARKLADMKPYVIVVMHPDDFSEFRTAPAPGEDVGFTSIPELKRTLADILKCRHEIRTVLLRDLHNDFSRTAFWSRTDRSWLDLLPDRLKTMVPSSILFPTSRARILFHSVARR